MPAFLIILLDTFYVSGFHSIYKSLESTKKIRIIIKIATSEKTYELLMSARGEDMHYSHFSSYEVKQLVGEKIIDEIEDSDDSRIVEEEVRKFVEWIRSGKIEVRINIIGGNKT
jgi:hypothetical protein